MVATKKPAAKPAIKPQITIRGLDADLYREAQIEAIKTRIPVYQWINKAIKEKLDRRPV